MNFYKRVNPSSTLLKSFRVNYENLTLRTIIIVFVI